MREIAIKLSSNEYYRFLKECNYHNLTPEEKIREIITFYVLMNKNREKLSQKKLWIRFRPDERNRK